MVKKILIKALMYAYEMDTLAYGFIIKKKKK